ncbi:MAG: family 20 glycosylhydrolase [Parachlamydiaceae bacterium]
MTDCIFLRGVIFFLVANFCVAWSDLLAFKVTKVKTELIAEGFDMQIDFQMEETFENWLFGFYMPTRFIYAPSLNINPNLSIVIYDQNEPSVEQAMQYLIKNQDNAFVYGNGTISAFQTNAPFSLKKGHAYTVSFTNSNQAAPFNVSTVAQSFFLFDQTTGRFLNNDASVTAYGDNIHTLENIGGYDHGATQIEIKKEIQANWDASSPLVPKNLADTYHLVPSPQSIKRLSGIGFSFLNKHSISVYNAFHDATIEKYLSSDFKINVCHVHNPSKAEIQILKTDAIQDVEGYRLKIHNNKILIEASTDTGAFYGLQTLRQLWHQKKKMKALVIEDAPRFKYRGLMLDVARHFFTVDQIKTIVDVMAAQKLNTLHIHFSDDEGFRLMLSSLLNEVTKLAQLRGFVRHSTNVPGVFPQANLDLTNYVNQEPCFPAQLLTTSYAHANSRYKGLFTPDNIRSLVSYANQSKITVIPEVDFPGHACAIVQADPVVFVDPNDKSHFVSIQGYYNDVIPVCLYDNNAEPINAFTNTMNQIVLAIATLFGKQTTLYYQKEVSLGGDEVSSTAWTDDSSCNIEPWKDLNALSKSHYFFKQMVSADPIASENIKFSGWQQIVQNDDGSIDPLSFSPKCAGHIWAWLPVESGAISCAQTLAKSHYPTVLNYASDLYFDLTYTPDAWEPGYDWAGSFLDTHAALRSALHANQTLLALSDDQMSHIHGLEGVLFSENLLNLRHLAYMALPKMTGLAEAAWSHHAVQKGRLNWKSLATRLGTSKKKAGFLNYLYKISSLEYRGHPNGIALEIPP